LAPPRDLIAASLSKEPIYSTALAVFTAFAFLLSIVGVAGVTLNSIAQRTREIGIRLAVGAEPAGIRRMILWQSARLAGAGIPGGVCSRSDLRRDPPRDGYRPGNCAPSELTDSGASGPRKSAIWGGRFRVGIARDSAERISLWTAFPGVELNRLQNVTQWRGLWSCAS